MKKIAAGHFLRQKTEWKSPICHLGWFKPFFPHLMANRFFSTIQQHLAAKEFATMEANLLHLLFSGINGVIYCIAYVCKHATHSRLSASAKLVADAATFHSVPPFPTAWKQNWITCSRFLVFASPLLGRVQIRTRYRWVWNHTSSIVSNFLSSVFDAVIGRVSFCITKYQQVLVIGLVAVCYKTSWK